MNKILLVTDTRGIVVGTWKRGETFTVRLGDQITFNTNGAPTFRGKLLNLPSTVTEKLITSKRVKVMA